MKLQQTKEYKQAMSEYIEIGNMIVSAMKQYKETSDHITFRAALTAAWNRLKAMEKVLYYNEDELMEDEDNESRFDEYGFQLVSNEEDPWGDEWFAEYIQLFNGDPMGREERSRITARGSNGILQAVLPDTVTAQHLFDEI